MEQKKSNFFSVRCPSAEEKNRLRKELLIEATEQDKTVYQLLVDMLAFWKNNKK